MLSWSGMEMSTIEKVLYAIQNDPNLLINLCNIQLNEEVITKIVAGLKEHSVTALKLKYGNIQSTQIKEII